MGVFGLVEKKKNMRKILPDWFAKIYEKKNLLMRSYSKIFLSKIKIIKNKIYFKRIFLLFFPFYFIYFSCFKCLCNQSNLWSKPSNQTEEEDKILFCALGANHGTHLKLERNNREKGDGRCNWGTKRATAPPSNPQ